MATADREDDLRHALTVAVVLENVVVLEVVEHALTVATLSTRLEL